MVRRKRWVITNREEPRTEARRQRACAWKSTRNGGSSFHLRARGERVPRMRQWVGRQRCEDAVSLSDPARRGVWDSPEH